MNYLCYNLGKKGGVELISTLSIVMGGVYY